VYRSKGLKAEIVVLQRLESPQILPISAWKSSSSFCTAAYFLAISSYLASHWSRSDSRAWTLRSKCPALTSVCRSLRVG